MRTYWWIHFDSKKMKKKCMSTKCHYHSSFVTAVSTVHECVEFSFEKHQRSFLLPLHFNALSSEQTNKNAISLTTWKPIHTTTYGLNQFQRLLYSKQMMLINVNYLLPLTSFFALNGSCICPYPFACTFISRLSHFVILNALDYHIYWSFPLFLFCSNIGI